MRGKLAVSKNNRTQRTGTNTTLIDPYTPCVYFFGIVGMRGSRVPTANIESHNPEAHPNVFVPKAMTGIFLAVSSIAVRADK